jgi:hypothetical protein
MSIEAHNELPRSRGLLRGVAKSEETTAGTKLASTKIIRNREYFFRREP